MTAAVRIWEGMKLLVLDDDRRREVAVALGMSFTRSRALRRLTAGPTTMRGLADRLGTDAPYATLIVNDLEERGLVERTVNPDDRRAKLVTVTESGRRAAELANEILSRPPAALAALDPDDLAHLDRIFTRLREHSGR